MYLVPTLKNRAPGNDVCVIQSQYGYNMVVQTCADKEIKRHHICDAIVHDKTIQPPEES